ncbi:SgcJ/EcaC family oxidoreductase [Streptomyces sp. CJ_13]|uniref:SgcJ/EcaC family oxidoreductase n=1 Tax=Streptomyces TaxID=1883 RepID=UPI000F42DCCB|nr:MULTISPECIES: SgcJ/EcaC family oxidoreductase [unclassified Streptomyces]AYV25283.1 SnoaL-like domain protein [Streptomyces sp. ADI95-16]MBT1187191.1 SgcJ/EcaC family oxidoreductase [Streptomyces sp. CJ_13]
MNKKTAKRAALATAAVLAFGAAAAYLYLDTTSGIRRTGEENCADVIPAGANAADGEAICATLDALIDAWARGDAEAYGRLFTEDGTYTTYVGSHYEGRADITEGHRALFKDFVKGTKLAASYLDLRFLGKDVAVLTGRGDDYSSGKPGLADLSKVQTYTLVRDTDGAWRIAAFHNTQRQNVMERFSFLYSPATAPKAEK